MDIKPILSSLRRSPTGAILVALQIALALAIVVNALFIIVQRFEKVSRDPGIDVANIFYVGWTPSGDKYQGEVTMREDLQILRNLPGVQAATVVNAVPLSGGGSSTSLHTEPNQKGRRGDVNYFQVDEQGVATFGVEIVEGRDLDAAVVTKPERNSSTSPPEILLTRDAAREMFPQ
jgi:putative ABC transport system permease protein